MAKWKREQLGQRNQWRRVDYCEFDDDTNMYRCALCQTGWFSPSALQSHFNGARHERCYNSALNEAVAEERTKKNFADRCLLAGSLDTRIDKLGLKLWKTIMRGIVYEYVLNPRIMYQDLLEQQVHDVVGRHLRKYEKMEQLSLLELAVWKYGLCNDTMFSTMQELHDYRALEEGFDPKNFAELRKITCGSQVIIPGVAQYL